MPRLRASEPDVWDPELVEVLWPAGHYENGDWGAGAFVYRHLDFVAFLPDGNHLVATDDNCVHCFAAADWKQRWAFVRPSATRRFSGPGPSLEGFGELHHLVSRPSPDREDPDSWSADGMLELTILTDTAGGVGLSTFVLDVAEIREIEQTPGGRVVEVEGQLASGEQVVCTLIYDYTDSTQMLNTRSLTDED